MREGLDVEPWCEVGRLVRVSEGFPESGFVVRVLGERLGTFCSADLSSGFSACGACAGHLVKRLLFYLSGKSFETGCLSQDRESHGSLLG